MLAPKRRNETLDHLFGDVGTSTTAQTTPSTHLVEFGASFDQSEANAEFALSFSMMYEHRLSDAQDAAAEPNAMDSTANQRIRPVSWPDDCRSHASYDRVSERRHRYAFSRRPHGTWPEALACVRGVRCHRQDRVLAEGLSAADLT
jgi:hypothetical protein